MSDKSWVSEIRKSYPPRIFEAGDTLLHAGDKATHIGLVHSGRAKAIAYSPNGNQVWLGYFIPGEFFGHISYLTDHPVQFELIADKTMSASLVPVSTLTENGGELARKMSEDIAIRLEDMIARLVQALTLSAKGRIYAELMRLAEPMGISPDRHLIRPNPVFVDVALRVNSTRETVSRTVSELQKAGVISRQPGALLIELPDKLRAMIA